MNKTLSRIWHSKWLLSIISGIFLGLSFPPFPFPFLQFPAFIFIFRLISLCSSARQAAYFIYPGFLIWNLITTYWLMLASLPAGIAAILANAVLMSLVVMLQFKVQKQISGPWIIALLQTAFWLSFEYLHHQWDLSWPWLTLANGWANATFAVQYISVTGFWGISFWVMLGSALLFQAIHKSKKSVQAGAGFIIVLFPVISLIQLPFVSPPHDDTIETVVVQPNFDSYEDLGGFDTPQQTLDLLFNLADSVRTPSTQLIVYPENGIHPYVSNQRTGDYSANQIKDQLFSQSQKWNSTLIGGTGYLEYFDKNDHPALPKESGGTPYLTYNSAVGFYPSDSMSVYRKHNLVPVVERFPFVHFFDSIDIFGLVNWADIQSYGKGYEADQFTVGSTHTPALICYDSVYPGWIRTFVKNDTGFITVITNDGWWGNTSGHIQHFAYARLRAIEFRRWVLRSANNGISGIISADGSVQKKTKYWTRTSFNYDMPVITEKTFYTRFGDWLPVTMLIFSACGVLLIFFNRKK